MDVLLVRLKGLRLGEVGVRQGRLVEVEAAQAKVDALRYWARKTVFTNGRVLGLAVKG